MVLRHKINDKIMETETSFRPRNGNVFQFVISFRNLVGKQKHVSVSETETDSVSVSFSLRVNSGH